jgi:hypothetical protein
VVVSLPEELPTNETLELVSVLSGELGLPVAEIVLNAALTPLFSADETQSLASFATLSANDAAERALVAGARRALAERLQAECVKRLSATGRPVRRMPRLVHGASSHAAALELSRHLR